MLPVSLVYFGHTNRRVSVSHESQCEIALVWALSRLVPDCQQGEVGEQKRAFLSQSVGFRCFAGRSHRMIRIRIRIAAASHDTMPLSESHGPRVTFLTSALEDLRANFSFLTYMMSSHDGVCFPFPNAANYVNQNKPTEGPCSANRPGPLTPRKGFGWRGQHVLHSEPPRRGRKIGAVRRIVEKCRKTVLTLSDGFLPWTREKYRKVV